VTEIIRERERKEKLEKRDKGRRNKKRKKNVIIYLTTLVSNSDFLNQIKDK
jgi:hypothetical protein